MEVGMKGIPVKFSRQGASSSELFNLSTGMKLLACLLLILLASCTKDESCTTCPPPLPDTTSHNFTWELDTLGDGNSSFLYDVAIINDTLAYAVGELYLKDSTGQFDPRAYNMARWTGTRWELIRIQFYTFCPQSATGSYPAKAIISFSAEDIWVGMDGSQVVRWNGEVQSAPTCIPVSVSRLWGVSSNDLYAVGANGGVARFDGTTWQRIESGTTLDIRDIYGQQDQATGSWEILAVASKVFVNFERKILRISGTTATALSDSGIAFPLTGVWFVSGKKYYVVGSGIYEKESLSESRWRNGPLDITQYFTYAVRGNGINDVFVVGSFGEVLHYNGSTWKSFREQTLIGNGSYRSVAVRGKMVIAVGDEQDRAVIARGTRQ